MERKPSYEELEKELEILKRNANPQSLLSFSGILFVEINPNGIVTLVNNKTCEVLGYEEKEIVGKNWFENFIPKQTKKELLSISKKLLLGEIEATEHYENPILTKNREERIVNWHNTPIKDENGNITGHLSLGDDITERKKTEADLIKLNVAVNNSLNEVYVFDVTTLKFSYVNQGVIKNLGYTFEELKTMSPLDINPEYTLKSFLTAIAPLRTGKVNKLQFQTIHQRKDNTTYPVEVNLSKFTIDKTSHFLALISDISERKHIENKIQDAKEIAEKREQQLKEAQKISHLGHWELDIINNKLIWSDEVYRILNLNPKKVKASEDLFMKRVHPEDRDGLNKAYLNAFKNKKPYQIKYRLLFKSGKIKHILGKGFTGYSDKGEAIFSIGTILDITSQIKIEEELIKAKEKAEKNKDKFKQLSNLTFEGILIHDNGIVVDINHSFSKMIGYSPKELIGKNIIEFFVPKKYHQIISKSIAKNYVLPFEIEGIKKDGTIFPVEIEARNFISENNKTLRVAAVRDITQRKKAEAENKKLSTIVEQSANCVVITDVQGNIEYVNSQFTKRTGYTKNEVLGKNPRFLNSGKHSKEDFVHLWSTMLAGKTFKGEFLNKAKNGNYYWEHQTNTPIKNESGEITNFLSIREDISLLKESELRLKTLVESSPNPIFFKDGEGRWIEANKAGLEMFDLQDVDYHGKTDRDLIAYSKFYKDALLECERTDEIAWKQKKATKSEKSVPESKILDVTKVPLFHHDNTRKGIITITNDITHLKKIEQDLLNQNKELKQISDELSKKNRLLFDSQSKFKNLFEQSPVSLWEEDFYEVKQLLNKKIAETDDLKTYLDENPGFVNECASKIKIINVNEITLKLLGIESKDELINNLSGNFNEKSFEIFKKELLAIALNKKEFSGETEFYRTDGKLIAALIKLVIIDDNEKAIVSIVDISALKQAEQELIKSKEKAEESDRLKTEFIQNMSHEIRTPMNGILGFSELLDNPELSSEKRKRFIEIIRNSTHQLLQIIDDIMEISVLEAKQTKAVENPICLNDLLLELFSIFDIKAKEKKIHLYFKKGLSDEQSTILTDRTKLNKIVSNLLENALKFTNEGNVELGYKLNKDSEPAELEIYVKDSGIGIKPEKQKLIFERFQQAEKDLSKKVGGLGLGLSIAKENTELLGGKLSVKSTYGEGTVFFVTIPYKPVNLVHKIAKEKEKKSGDKEKYTILIAEDEEVNFMVLKILLEDKLKLPCTIIHAKDGLEAVELSKSNPEISLVLMDIKMPKLDGHEATRIIKEFRPDLPIIAQTAYSSPEEKEKAFLAGCDDFIAKPISKDVLNSVIVKYLLANKNNESN